MKKFLFGTLLLMIISTGLLAGASEFVEIDECILIAKEKEGKDKYMINLKQLYITTTRHKKNHSSISFYASKTYMSIEGTKKQIEKIEDTFIDCNE